MDIRKSAPTYNFDIYIAGDVKTLRRALQEYVSLRGFCVSFTETEFIYSGGEETGARIGIINYPRFPIEKDKLELQAEAIAYRLMESADQASCSIVGPETTTYLQVKDKTPVKGPGCDECSFTGLLYDWNDWDPKDGWKMADRKLTCECK